MTKRQQETVLCQICKEQKKISEVLSAEMIREPIVERIKATHPDWSSKGFICISDLNRFRTEYVQDVIKTDKGELSALEEQVVRSLTEQELLSKNINVEYDRQRTLGERMADKLADFGGN
jgi:phage terminase large subunit-like protein